MMTAAVHDGIGLIVIRFFLGCCESPIAPAIVYYLSLWYDKREMALRIAIYYSVGTMAGSLGGLAAAGIMLMDGFLQLRSWQWLFLIEGGITVILGVICTFYLPEKPSEAWFLSADDRSRMDEKQRHETQADGDIKPILYYIRAIISDPITWGFSLMAICNGCAVFAISLFLPSIVHGMGWKGATAQAMSAPPYLIAAVIQIAASSHSDHVLERGLHVAVPLSVAVMGYLSLALVPPIQELQYTLICVTVAALMAHIAPALSWMNNSYGEDRLRALAIGFTLTFSSLGGVLAGQLFRESDAPNYRQGHLAAAVMAGIGVLFTLGTRWLMRRANARAGPKAHIYLL